MDKKESIEEFIERTTSGQFMGHITQVINDKIEKHYIRYDEVPKYIKMPTWCFEEIKRASTQFSTPFRFENSTEPYFRGMRICETEIVKEMKEIEVF